MQAAHFSEIYSSDSANSISFRSQQTALEWELSKGYSKEQGILEFLIRVVKPDMIFMVQKRMDCMPYWYDFVLVLSGSSRQSFSELEPVLDFAASFCASISCSLLDLGQLKEMLYKGEFFYLTNCTYKNLVYNKMAARLPKVSFAALLATGRRARASFEAGNKISGLFYRGACMYAAENENAMATFMLQQAIEQCYRWLTRAFYGRDQKTHSLRVLKTHVRRIAPGLLTYFPEENKEDKELLDLLERAYLDSRYSSDFVITNKQLVTLMERTKDLLKEASKVFEVNMRVLDIGE